MIDKREILKKLEQDKRAAMIVTPFMAAYFLGYMKSQKGEKIAEGNVENLLAGACLSMGINPVDDISELFNILFGLGEEEEEDKPLQYYA